MDSGTANTRGSLTSASPYRQQHHPSNDATTTPKGTEKILEGLPKVLQKILRRPRVQEVTGLSRSQIYLLMSRGKFPLPIPLDGDGGRAVGWLENEILDYQEARIEERKLLGGVPGGMWRDAKSTKGATEVS